MVLREFDKLMELGFRKAYENLLCWCRDPKHEALPAAMKSAYYARNAISNCCCGNTPAT
jgi:hypothetical protein